MGAPKPELSFRVIGLPAPQGSKKLMPTGVLIESSKKVKPWREAVIAAARGYEVVLDGPVWASLDFVLPRPTGARKGQYWQWRTPDLDKLCRSTFDALQLAGLLAADSRICRLSAAKHLADAADPWVGADIALGPLAVVNVPPEQTALL